jgi:hypothetical protein
MARLACLAASAGESATSQRAAVIRCPLKLAEASETSQTIGGPMISGRSIFSRGHPAWSEIIGVSVGPPYARECVRLANLTSDANIRDQLMQMAREWMAVVMHEEKRPEPKVPIR